MDKNDHLKCFIKSTKDYLKNQNESTASTLHRNLNVLATSPDFAPPPLDTPLAPTFYESLYNLLSSLEPSSTLFWACVDLLTTLSAQALDTLIHIYHFPQLLAPFLTSSLPPDQRMKLLKLLKRLTKGIRIHWHDTWLSGLMLTLTGWIDPGQDPDVITNALSLLINLCRKNPPAIYTLVNPTNNKKLNKNLLRLQTNDPKIQILCCKILLTMEETNHEIPEQFILRFVEVTFQIITKTIKEGRKKLLNETVDFFEEVRLHEKTKDSLKTFKHYGENLQTILEILEESTPEVREVVLKFFSSVLKLRIKEVESFLTIFAEIAMGSLRNFRVSKNALGLLKVVVRESMSEDPLAVLSKDEVEFIVSLMSSDDLDDELIAELLQVVQELVQDATARGQVSRGFPEARAREILKEVLESAGNPREMVKDRVYGKTAVYVNLLALVAQMARAEKAEPKWVELWAELGEKRRIQMLLAAAVLSSDLETKAKTLRVISELGDNTEGAVKCLAELENVFLIEKPLNEPEFHPTFGGFNAARHPAPSGERIMKVLERLEEKMQNNDIKNIHVTDIMELSQFRLDDMQRTEEHLRKSLAFQEHRAVQMTLKFGKMQEVLFTAEKKCESVQSQNAKLMAINDQLRNEIRGLKKSVLDKSKTIEDQSERIDNLTREKQELKTENEEFMRNCQFLQESITKRDNRLEEKMGEIEGLKGVLEIARGKTEEYVAQCRERDAKILEKEEVIKKLEAELVDLRKMRDSIYMLTAQKRENQNTTT